MRPIAAVILASLACTSSTDEPAPGTPSVDTPLETPTGDTSAGGDVPEAQSDTVAIEPRPFPVLEGEAAGTAVIDITPTDFETFTDLNGNHVFDGCRHEPAGGTEKCPEPYDDKDGDKDFDAAFIGGFGELRAAHSVHDPIEVRAMVIARDSHYLAFVSVDVIGLAGDRIQRAQDRLAEKGWERERIIVVSSHTHQGPDVRGLWGSPLGGQGVWSGARPEYNASITDAIVAAVDAAAKALKPAQFRVGATRLRDRSEAFNGEAFGGTNPTSRMQGLINDGRDPVIVSDQLAVIEATEPGGGAIGRLLSYSGHPELVGEDNNELSADYVHYLRTELEARRGGTTVFLPECLGGMQSALGGHVPMVAEDNTWLMAPDTEGKEGPVFSEEAGFDYARSAAVHLADAAVDALDAGEPLPLDPFWMKSATLYVPVDNGAFQILFQLGIFDVDPSIATRDPKLCPGWSGTTLHPGCVPTTVWRLRLGSVDILTAPGEVLPELFWGLPDDPDFRAESTDVLRRGVRDGVVARYFPQHPAPCDGVPYAECVNSTKVDDCDCKAYHIAPYTLQARADAPVPVEQMTGKYRFLVGMADDHLGYIVPEPDFNRLVSQLTGEDGDHYEETNSVSYRFATMLYDTWQVLLTD